MARLRQPPRIAVPETAYADAEPITVPDCLSDLELVAGRCYSAAPVTFCESPGPGIVCASCAMVELGESWENFKARTNSATPRGKFYRELEREQAAVDVDFARARAWAKRQEHPQGGVPLEDAWTWKRSPTEAL